MAGYSGTPLAQKLGIKPGATLAAINPPPNYRRLLAPIPPRVHFVSRAGQNANFIHLFCDRRRILDRELIRLRSKLADAGILWVSWPKKSSGIASDITEDTIRSLALPLGLVDIKVCAVDQTWSALKLMIRREQRQAKRPRPADGKK